MQDLMARHIDLAFRGGDFDAAEAGGKHKAYAVSAGAAFESDGSEARSASISTRSDCNNASENVGDSRIE
jgi:hypothetical protein